MLEPLQPPPPPPQLQPGASFFLPPRRRPPGPAHTAPSPGRAHTSPPSSPAPLPHEGSSAASATAADGRKQGRGKPAGQAKTTLLGPLWRGERGRGSRLPAPLARPPRHRKYRRLGSLHIQFKLSPPLSPLPPGAPSPRPGPAVGPPHLLRPLLPASPQGVTPVRSGGRRAPPKSGADDLSRGGPKLRLTHGAAVDAPLLSSSGSRTDRHPLPPPRPARAQRSPPILQSRLRRFRGVAARRRCPAYAGDSGRTPPLALARIPLPPPPPPLQTRLPGLADASFDLARVLPRLPAASLHFEHDFIGITALLLLKFSRHV